MEIVLWNAQELPVALGAIRTIASTLTRRQAQYLEVLARLHGAMVNVTGLPKPPAWHVAGTIRDPQRRKRLVQLAVIFTMVDDEVLRSEADAVANLARALEVDEPAVRTLRKLVTRNALRTRIDVMRRILGKFLSEAWRDERFGGVHNVLAGFIAGGTVDEATAARYAKLAQYPEDSLGRALWDHAQRNEFALPGSRGAIPERILFHDIGHLLSGYDTNPAGEIQQAAFQAGFLRSEGFAFLFFGVIQFHLGMKMTPVAEGEVGYFDIEKVMTALARGAACKVDLSAWNFWENAGRPLDDVREELGVSAIPMRPSIAA